jgi:hypothetical protein
MFFFKDLRWRARHHTPRMDTQTVDHSNNIKASYEGQPGPLPPFEIPISLTIQTTYGTMDALSIYNWDEHAEKSRCFDFDDFLNATDILRIIWVPTSELSPVFGVTSV